MDPIPWCLVFSSLHHSWLLSKVHRVIYKCLRSLLCTTTVHALHLTTLFNWELIPESSHIVQFNQGPSGPQSRGWLRFDPIPLHQGPRNTRPNACRHDGRHRRLRQALRRFTELRVIAPETPLRWTPRQQSVEIRCGDRTLRPKKTSLKLEAWGFTNFRTRILFQVQFWFVQRIRLRDAKGKH